LFLASPFASAEACPIELARYAVRGFEGGFVHARSEPAGDLAFFLRSKRRERTFWFEVRAAGTGKVALQPMTASELARSGLSRRGVNASIRRPLEYLAADASHHFLVGPPTQGSEAPTYILLPDLPDVMWYGVDDPREDAPLAFFHLSGCGGRP
jgi:hypothetical protein